MHRLQICLDRVADVRVAAHNLHSAYLLRTRTHRLLLSVQRMLAEEYGENVIAPRRVDPGRNGDPAMRRLAELTNDLLESTRHLSQRSVAFDRRWEREWEEVEDLLGRMEIALCNAMCGPSASSRG
jgi:hypothetical protein